MPSIRGDDVLGAFDRAYQIYTLGDLDANFAPHFEIPSGFRSERSGIVLMVECDDGTRWDAIVRADDVRESVRRVIFATSDPAVFCVLIADDAYFIDVHAPHKAIIREQTWQPVEVYPDVDEGLVIYVDDHGVEAYGPRGQVWRTPLDGCGIFDARFDGSRLTAAIANYEGTALAPFAIDRKTGHLIERSVSG